MNYSDENIIENEYMSMRLEDGIIICESKKQYALTVDIARQAVENRLKISKGISRPLYLDLRSLRYADAHVRKYLSGEEAIQLVSAGAFLVESPVTQFLMRLFLSINRPARPSKAFTDKKKAIAWLKKYR